MAPPADRVDPLPMPFGAEVQPGGGTVFRLWAPDCAEVQLELLDAHGQLQRTLAMARAGGGGWQQIVPEAGAGQRYRYRVPTAAGQPAAEGLAVPDPASRRNPEDVHGPSEVVDPRRHVWQQRGWRGRPWHEAVVYELHVGSFTPEGSFAAAAARLPELAALGITVIELMPVADFPGRRGWGYDGVLPFAPEAAYGTPDELRALVDTAHGLGLMVLLDVVYNHFGPDGNYLHAYCPSFFRSERQTPWGPSINVDGEGSAMVRRWFVSNALYWVHEFRFDGLRLDAVHAIHDDSGRHLVAEIAAALRDGPGRERQVHLVLENEHNTARWLLRDGDGAPLVATAQWNDDLHHAAHVLATGETAGYYQDFAEGSAHRLGCALAAGFVYQGQPSAFRGGEPRGEPSALLPSGAFVSFLQNHDQTGNRALGERLDALAPVARVEALLACLLLSPHVPMLFMGEEFAATTPFLYFCDFHGELGRAVSEGRRAEFAAFPAFRDEAARSRIPDPNAETTFEASRLRHEEAASPAGRRRRALLTQLLALRRDHLVPLLPRQRHGGQLVASGEDWFVVEWPLGPGRVWCLRANLGRSRIGFERAPDEHEIYATQPAPPASRLLLGPDTVQVSLRGARDEPFNPGR